MNTSTERKLSEILAVGADVTIPTDYAGTWTGEVVAIRPGGRTAPKDTRYVTFRTDKGETEVRTSLRYSGWLNTPAPEKEAVVVGQDVKGRDLHATDVVVWKGGDGQHYAGYVTERQNGEAGQLRVAPLGAAGDTFVVYAASRVRLAQQGNAGSYSVSEFLTMADTLEEQGNEPELISVGQRAKALAARDGHRTWEALSTTAQREYLGHAREAFLAAETLRRAEKPSLPEARTAVDLPEATVEGPRFPEGTPEYDAFAAELRTELAKFAKGEPPYGVPSIVVMDRDAAAQNLADVVSKVLPVLGGRDDDRKLVWDALADYREATKAN